jgi:hypothetical protein
MVSSDGLYDGMTNDWMAAETATKVKNQAGTEYSAVSHSFPAEISIPGQIKTGTVCDNLARCCGRSRDRNESSVCADRPRLNCRASDGAHPFAS